MTEGETVRERLAQFPLDEGDAILRFPEPMSEDSFQDFADWLALVIRREKRNSERKVAAAWKDTRGVTCVSIRALD